MSGILTFTAKAVKIRRLYIPKNLRIEAAKWLKEKGFISGYIFPKPIWDTHYHSWYSLNN